jgi:hypothetical protein
MTRRELSIQSGEHPCSIDVNKSDTMADVRRIIVEEFDDFMFPEGSPEFVIICGSAVLGRKQESKKLAWDAIDARLAISLRARDSFKCSRLSNKRAATSCVAANEEAAAINSDEASSKEKKARTEAAKHSHSRSHAEDGLSKEENVPETSTSMYDTHPSTKEVRQDQEKQDDKKPGPEICDKGSAVTHNQGQKRLSGGDAADGDIKETTKRVYGLTDYAHISTKSGGNPADMNTANESDTEDDEVMELFPEVNAAQIRNEIHGEYFSVVAQSHVHLEEMKQLLRNPDNAVFFSQARRKEWLNDIASLLGNSTGPPDTVIGCLGGTGVGKSSLLNALLDEAQVLPTSGSRGCTAAVVELRFNHDLLKHSGSLDEKAGTCPVYKGRVEFMALDEWHWELEILLDECCRPHEAGKLATIFTVPPDKQRPSCESALAAWAKIEQVYGRGSMNAHLGKYRSDVWNVLALDSRVVTLLAGGDNNSSGSEKAHTIIVEEGTVGFEQATLLGSHLLSMLDGDLRRLQRQWANAFRNKINDFVYRSGSGDGPQTWPLIRKVVLHGPWAVLSTGACLVDLPGVRDANSARAKVSATYIQHCSHIWIAAPIKRAVDDCTAKELMGEQFKRRLFMDGQYGNVSFICTHTDECETTEIVRDHADVARQDSERWERISALQDEIRSNDKEKSEIIKPRDNLIAELKKLDQCIITLLKEAKRCPAKKQGKIIDSLVFLPADGKAKQQRIAKERELRSEIKNKLNLEKKKITRPMKRLDSKTSKLQRKLKPIAAAVRNEFSMNRLQADFRAGLEELTGDQNIGENGVLDGSDASNRTKLDKCHMKVYCISSNDYLKIQGVKPSSDGGTNTFTRAKDTGIPGLREAVHRTTAQAHCAFATKFVSVTSGILDNIKICAGRDLLSGVAALDGPSFLKSFEDKMGVIDSKIANISADYQCMANAKIKKVLEPSLKAGTEKANEATMTTVASWGSNFHRSKHFQEGPEHNGLHYSTYAAAARRDGGYDSNAAGLIDLNQELYDPMEKAFSADWQSTMDEAVSCVFLDKAELQVGQLLATVAKEIARVLTRAGMQQSCLNSMENAANRAGRTAIETIFAEIRGVASKSQRDLHRSVLPQIQDRMLPGYEAVTTEHSGAGAGVFCRMKDVLERHANKARVAIFTEAKTHVLKEVDSLIKKLASIIMDAASRIKTSLRKVYSICWDEGKVQEGVRTPVIMDSAAQQRIRVCQEELNSSLERLNNSQGKEMELLELKEDAYSNVTGVENWEDNNEKQMNEAPMTENYMQHLDDMGSGNGVEVTRSCNTALPQNAIAIKIKTENLQTLPVVSPAAANETITKSQPRTANKPREHETTEVPPTPVPALSAAICDAPNFLSSGDSEDQERKCSDI